MLEEGVFLGIHLDPSDRGNGCGELGARIEPDRPAIHMKADRAVARCKILADQERLADSARLGDVRLHENGPDLVHQPREAVTAVAILSHGQSRAFMPAALALVSGGVVDRKRLLDPGEIRVQERRQQRFEALRIVALARIGHQR